MTDAETIEWHRARARGLRQGVLDEGAYLASRQADADSVGGEAVADIMLRARDRTERYTKDALERAAHHTRAADAIEENARLRAALVALTTNPHLNLGDLVYTVREREGLGWEGPAVKEWSDAVQAADAALRKPDAAGGDDA